MRVIIGLWNYFSPSNKPYTVREHLKSGVLRGIKRGRLWRVPESALVESSAPAPFVSHDENGETGPSAVKVRVTGRIVSRKRMPFVQYDDEPLCEDEIAFPPLPSRKTTGIVVRTGRLPSQLEPDEIEAAS